MKTVLVTGAGGFIGQHTVRALLERGHGVIAVDWDRKRLDTLQSNPVKICADVRHEYALASVFDLHRPEAVIHLAAQSAVPVSWKDWRHDAHLNTIGTINIVELCQRYGVERIVYAGSGGTVYGEPTDLPVNEDTPVNPLSPYGVSKYAGECYVRMSGLSHAVLRYPNVYGPGQSPEGAAGVIAIFTGSILLDKACIIYGDGQNTRDYVFIDDVVEANIAALEGEASGVFNIGTGVGVDVNAVLKAISMVTGKEPTIKYEPARVGDVLHSALDASKAEMELHWSPKVSFNEGIAMTIEAMQGGQMVSRRFHGAEIAGSIPAPATKEDSHAV